MSGKLVIIRGNSGSGKSTIAAELRHRMGYGTMLVPQDTIRRDIVRVADELNNPSIELISSVARYGNLIGYDVIIEGILDSEKYGTMLEDVAKNFSEVYVYYFDLSFEETLARHETKEKRNEFGENEMRQWWVEKDYLNWPNEVLLKAELSKDHAIEMILQQVNHAR